MCKEFISLQVLKCIKGDRCTGANWPSQLELILFFFLAGIF